MPNFFKKSKNPLWGLFGPFIPKFGQKWIFLETRALSVFQYSNYLPLCKKSEHTNDPFLRKMPNWQTDNGDFIGSLMGRGPIFIMLLGSKSESLGQYKQNHNVIEKGCNLDQIVDRSNIHKKILLTVPSQGSFPKLQLIIRKKLWNNFYYTMFLLATAQKVSLKFLKLYFKMEM